MHSLEFLFKFKLDSNAPHFYRHNVKRMRSQFAESKPSAYGSNRGTIGLLILFCVCYVLFFIPEVSEAAFFEIALNQLSFRPWQVFSYFLAHHKYGGLELIFFMISMLWWYSFGGMFERTWGTKSLLLHFTGSVLINGIVCAIAQWLLKNSGVIDSSWLPVAFISVIICANQAETPTNLWGMQTQMKWVAVFIAILVIFNEGIGQPAMGLVAALPLALAWFYGKNGVQGFHFGRSRRATPADRKKNQEFDEFMGKVRSKEKDRAEQERLRKLFEGSIADDDTPESK